MKFIFNLKSGSHFSFIIFCEYFPAKIHFCAFKRKHFVFLFSAFIILLLVTTILYVKYQLNIKVFLYSRGITFVKEEEMDEDKEFDAFMSFSHEDDEFVIKEIISGEKTDKHSLNKLIFFVSECYLHVQCLKFFLTFA